MPHFHHFSICNQTQSNSHLVIFHQNTKAIALRFGHKCLIFITFQSAVKINQCQIWSLFTKIPRLCPVCWPQMPHFHHFSICNQAESISYLFTFHQNTKAIALLFGHTCLIFITIQSAININQFQSWLFVTKIPRLQPYFLATNASFSSLVNLQSNSINFTFVHFSPKYQGYSLTFWPHMPHFHHFSICNQNQSISKVVICHQNTKPIALLFGQKCLTFITFQSAIKLNQFHIWSLFTKIPRLQPVCWPQMPHFHHFSICNQAESISYLFTFHQNTKAIALLFLHKCLIFITFQSAIKINQFQRWLFVTKIPSLQPYFLAKNASFSSLFNLQSNSINFTFGHSSPKYQGYSLCVRHKCLIFITV